MSEGRDPFRMLISYWYFKNGDLEAVIDEHFPLGRPETFADSGAFTAFTRGTPIDVHDYAAWLLRYRHLFTVAANLDVIGDGETSARGTWENQRVLEDEYGLDVLPVFHAAEPWEALDRLLSHGYRYIGLGGLVGRPVATIMPWLVRCFRLAAGTAVFHGFGQTSWEPMFALPWYSLDSTSWGSGYRFGNVRCYDRRKRTLIQIDVGNESRDVFRHAETIRRLGFDPNEYAKPGNADRAAVARLSAVAWRDIESVIRERHGQVRRPDTDDTGVRMYAADGSIDNLADGDCGLRLYLADNNLSDLHNGASALYEQGRIT